MSQYDGKKWNNRNVQLAYVLRKKPLGYLISPNTFAKYVVLHVHTDKNATRKE